MAVAPTSLQINQQLIEIDKELEDIIKEKRKIEKQLNSIHAKHFERFKENFNTFSGICSLREILKEGKNFYRKFTEFENLRNKTTVYKIIAVVCCITVVGALFLPWVYLKWSEWDKKKEISKKILIEDAVRQIEVDVTRDFVVKINGKEVRAVDGKDKSTCIKEAVQNLGLSETQEICLLANLQQAFHVSSTTAFEKRLFSTPEGKPMGGGGPSLNNMAPLADFLAPLYNEAGGGLSTIGSKENQTKYMIPLSNMLLDRIEENGRSIKERSILDVTTGWFGSLKVKNYVEKTVVQVIIADGKLEHVNIVENSTHPTRQGLYVLDSSLGQHAMGRRVIAEFNTESELDLSLLSRNKITTTTRLDRINSLVGPVHDKDGLPL